LGCRSGCRWGCRWGCRETAARAHGRAATGQRVRLAGSDDRGWACSSDGRRRV